MANKVEFGISNLHVGLFNTADDGTVTLGAPEKIPGAVSFSPEEQSEKTDFYADNVIYWSGYSGGSFEGDLEVAKFPKKFLTDFMGYVELADGGLGIVKGTIKPNVYLMFQVEGDAESRRVILYNATFGAIKREFSTIEESKEPATETVPVNVVGDQKTGLSLASYTQSDAGYATLFTNPPVPEIPAQSE